MKTIVTIIISILFLNTINAQNFKSLDEAKGLEIGTKAPMFQAIDQDGNVYILKEALKKGPVVVVFFRGFWCPYCNKHLQTLQDSLSLIEQKGATVIAISPEKPEYLQESEERTGAKFTLLFDEDYKIAKSYDVNYKPKSSQTMMYNVFVGAKLKKTHSDNSQQLPIPATFVIETDGTIIWRHFDPNYKNRSNVSDILKILE